MGLTKYKLGELIEETYFFNNDLKYDLSFVRGISNTKQITTTKADTSNGWRPWLRVIGCAKSEPR